MRVALVHDWLTGSRGGERVLEALLDLFPEAEIFTLLHSPGTVSRRIEDRPIHVSPLDHVPGIASRYRWFLPVFPAMIERFDMSGFDLVVSSSHCVAKGVRTSSSTRHVCYCHTPMRYAWDLFDSYFGPGRAAPPVRMAARFVMPALRRWDVRTARRVTTFVANSHHVRDRIRRHYGRDATVVYPPVDIGRFRAAPQRDDCYVIVSALVPYKRIDIAVDAFNTLGRRLVIAGEGSELSRLARRARSNITFTGRITDAEVADLLGRARAFILPGEEDFGIAAVEAQAAGAPVIAFGHGGARETVIADADSDRATGVFFHEPTPQSLAAAVLTFERRQFRTPVLRANAEQFEPAHFRLRMAELLAMTAEDRGAPCASPS
jgi:glycosyltransferase involved in cell wall biosynthesis